MLFSSFKPSARMWSSFLSTFSIYVSENERRHADVQNGKDRERQMVEPERGEPETLGERADADLLNHDDGKPRPMARPGRTETRPERAARRS